MITNQDHALKSPNIAPCTVHDYKMLDPFPFPNLFVPQFLSLQNADNNGSYFVKLF